MKNQKGVIHLAAPLLVVVIVSAVLFVVLILFGAIKNPFSKLSLVGQKGPKVAVKSEYKNPFDKKTQYVNPFETYKNPFTVK